MSGRSEARRRLGRVAEDAVADYLRGLGWRILAQNLRVGNLEIDVVARAGPLVVVVEVRTRGLTSYEPAFASVSSRKRERLVRAANQLWRERLRDIESVERVRIDVAAVSFDTGGAVRIEYVPGAVVG